jgi:hypothetical protein
MGQSSPKTHGKRCVLSPGRSLANPLDMIFVVLRHAKTNPRCNNIES